MPGHNTVAGSKFTNAAMVIFRASIAGLMVKVAQDVAQQIACTMTTSSPKLLCLRRLYEYFCL